MRICLLADHSGILDEGMRKTAYYLKQQLSKRHDVVALSLAEARSAGFFRKVRAFRPDIVHYIPGPSIFSFVLMTAIKACCRTKTIISASHPAFYGVRGLGYGPYYAASSLFQPLVPLLRPGRILVQSADTESLFRRMGCRTDFLPGGVDAERFHPATPQKRQELRGRYGIPPEKRVILHCGSFRRWRNLDILLHLQKADNQVLVAGTATRADRQLCRELERSGILVWQHYIKDIEEVYQMADVYVFPVIDRRGAIDVPLSVLEAMSCNLPVVTSRFGALPRLFSEGNGFAYFNDVPALVSHTQRLQGKELPIRTRDMVLPFAWEKIAARLEEIYAASLSPSGVAEKKFTDSPVRGA